MASVRIRRSSAWHSPSGVTFVALATALGILAAEVRAGERVPLRSGLLEETAAVRRCQKRVAELSRATLGRIARLYEGCADRTAQGRGAPAPGCEATLATRVEESAAALASAIASSCPAVLPPGLSLGADCRDATSGEELGACQAQQVARTAATLVLELTEDTGKLEERARRCRREALRLSLERSLDRLARVQSCKLRGFARTDGRARSCAAADPEPVGGRDPNRLARAAIVAACAGTELGGAALFDGRCAYVRTPADVAACVLGAGQDALEELLVAEFGSGTTGRTAAARAIVDPSECIRGPLARCRPGDLLLENGTIRVVVQAPQRNLFGIGQFGGQIIDAARGGVAGVEDRDHFEEWAFALNLENTAHFTDVEILNDGSDGRAALLRATGVDDLLDYINPSSAIGAFGLPFPQSADDVDLPVEITTDYELAPDANWVRVTTTVRNVGSASLPTFLGEFISGSGEVQLFQPGYGFGEPLVTTRCPAEASNPCNYLVYRGYGEAEGVSYGYVYEGPPSSTFTAGGVTIPLLGQEVPLALVGGEGPRFVIAPAGEPGDSATVVRYFVVGDGSVSSVSDARSRIQHRATGRLEGRVTVGGAGAAGAQVAILGDVAEGPGFSPLDANVVTIARTDENGRYSVDLAPGAYDAAVALRANPYERGSPLPLRRRVRIDAFATARLDLGLPETGGLRVRVTETGGAPIAARVSVVGFDPSPDPLNRQDVFGIVQNATTWFGDPGVDGLPFGIAKGLLVEPSGDTGVVALEPGTYRAVVSHGPEYSIDQIDVEIAPGEVAEVHAEIARVIDTTGFIAGDFHVHSIDSPDATTSRRNRVRSMLADGVDFFTPSDHDFRADFQPVLEEMGVTELLSVAPSAEITPFDYGHFIAWPMTIDPAQVNGGGVDFGRAAPPGQDFPSRGSFALTPGEIFALARSDPGTSNTVQINHIDTHFGIEGGFGLAIDTGVVPPRSTIPGRARRLDPAVTNYFSDGFDALELWVGDDRYHVVDLLLGQNLGDWFNLLNQGIVRSGVSDSDTHQRFSGPAGMPRTMVASSRDEPGALAALADDLSANVNAGRVVGTNGPWLRVRLEAASTAESASLALGEPLVVRTTDGRVSLRLEIQSPTWAEFDRIEYYVNATTERRFEPRRTSAGEIALPRYRPDPYAVQTAGTDFEVRRVVVDPSIAGAERLEATSRLELSGLAEDAWIVAVVRGTDGVSQPLFPIMASSLRRDGNASLADLVDGNLGEEGVLAVAFTNPLFVEVEGDGWNAPGLRIRGP